MGVTSNPIPAPASSPEWLHSLLSFSGPEMPRPGTGVDEAPLYVQGRGENDKAKWRCLACLTGGEAEGDTVQFGVLAHLPYCNVDTGMARARMDLLEIISSVSEAEYAAGWLIGVEERLIRRGSLWVVLADSVGWPVGYLGLDGWDVDLNSALARRNLSLSDISVLPGFGT